MSRRTAESNKAILAAWNKEIELVQEGKGTRDWTPKQQQDISELEEIRFYNGLQKEICLPIRWAASGNLNYPKWMNGFAPEALPTIILRQTMNKSGLTDT